MLYFRITSYLLVFGIYLALMESRIPSVTGWADYHGQRLFNAVEYLRLNGFLTNYGYSIWSSSARPSLSDIKWQSEIYLSQPAITYFWPYSLINHFLGKEGLYALGPILDKFVILITGIMIAEIFLVTLGYRSFQDLGNRKLILKNLNNSALDLIKLMTFRNFSTGRNTSSKNQLPRESCTTAERVDSPALPPLWVGLATFSLFCSSVWTFQMYRAMWNEIWFLFFLCSALCLLMRKNFVAGTVMITLASLMSYIQGVVLGVIYLAVLTLSKLFRETTSVGILITPIFPSQRKLLIFCGCCIVPAIFYSLLRLTYSYSSPFQGLGSSLLSRIGISGHDIHNGGILGALQFLGGTRVTGCLAGRVDNNKILALELDLKIEAFNCLLSITGMLFISIFAVIGIIWLVRNRPYVATLMFPIGLTLLILASVLQQSFSAHLFGHSYAFSAIFACGIVGCCIKGAEMIGSRVISTIVFSAFVAAIVLLSIRVSMLTYAYHT